MAPNFAVIDCETTGFTNLDRVLEIAVVVLDGKTLATVDEFDTLVNPSRDVGRADVLGITPSMLGAAPTFSEILGGLARRIDGAVLVAHNLPFDQRFLSDECDRVDARFDPGSGICTYQLTGVKLATAAERFGITLDGHHRALVDARATAELLRRVIDDAAGAVPVSMPTPSRSPAVRTLRREAVGGTPTTPLAQILARACYPSSLEACVAYFEMLDWVLADGIVTAEERRLLDDQIRLLNLSAAQVRAMHEAYFKSILRAIERDMLVSGDECALLASVAQSLGLGDQPLPQVTRQPVATSLAQGARICFTGTAMDEAGEEIRRGVLEQIAATRGFQPVADVTKKSCDLLVAADPSSASGKAQKARRYGIPVLSVTEFLREH